MVLKILNHPFGYDMKNLCTVFFPFEKIKDDGEEEILVITSASENTYTVRARIFDKELEKSHTLLQNEDKATAMSVLLYRVLSEMTGFKPPWGILFGVRPAKLMHKFADEMGEDHAKEHFINEFLVTQGKTELAAQVMKHENKIIALSKRESFSLYVSIPFCPAQQVHIRLNKLFCAFNGMGHKGAI